MRQSSSTEHERRRHPDRSIRSARRGSNYLNNRHYDPTTGVFISVDPLVTITGQPYIYASGNPTTLSDPTGLDPDTSARIRQKVEENGGCTYSSGQQCYRDKHGALGRLQYLGASRAYGPSYHHVARQNRARRSDPSRWCGSSSCPTVGPGYQFEDDSQAIAFLDFVTADEAGGIYQFVDSAVNSGELWAHYTTASGKQAVRWKPGVGWVRRSTGLTAGSAVSVGRTLEVGGRSLIVLGGALEGAEQWQRDDGYDSGVRLFRSFAAGGTKAAFTWGGASATGGGAAAFCSSGATVSCGGPWGTAAVVGVAGVIGGFFGNKAADVVIERVL